MLKKKFFIIHEKSRFSQKPCCPYYGGSLTAWRRLVLLSGGSYCLAEAHAGRGFPPLYNRCKGILGVSFNDNKLRARYTNSDFLTLIYLKPNVVELQAMNSVRPNSII